MILTSKKGQEMIETVSPIYYQSKIMQGIFQSIGMEWDDIDRLSDDILLQLFPQTATWGLRYWEELLKIPVNETTIIERRRALVMTRIKLRSPMTPERISNVISALTKGQSEYVEVTENIEPHVFMVNVGTKAQGVDYLDVYRTLKRIKPSHESFYLGNTYLRSFGLKRGKIYGFSKIIHAIGTFLSSKNDVEFIATKGHNNIGKVGIEKNKIQGTSDPLVCSKTLVSRIDGFLNEDDMEFLKSRITGESDPLVCSKNLKYTILGILNDELLNEDKETKRGNSKPLTCSKKLKFTRIEVV